MTDYRLLVEVSLSIFNLLHQRPEFSQYIRDLFGSQHAYAASSEQRAKQSSRNYRNSSMRFRYLSTLLPREESSLLAARCSLLTIYLCLYVTRHQSPNWFATHL